MQFQTSSAFEKKKVKTEGIHKNLVEERIKCDFNQEQMAHIIWGSKERYDEFVKIRDVFANDPILRNDPSYFDLERTEQFEDGFKKINRLY